MFVLIIFSLNLWSAYGYFTLPGKCPENVSVQENFKLEDFYGKWYQAYYYSSDGQRRNNCSIVEIDTLHSSLYGNDVLVHFNQSRVDRGLFHRYSIARVVPPRNGSPESVLNLEFEFKNAPRRLQRRNYDFKILSTNYRFYATAYTCQYSPLIDKHFVYIWILSRNPILNDVSKELALRPIQNIGIIEDRLIKDDFSKCKPKYYEDVPQEPSTFRCEVKIM